MQSGGVGKGGTKQKKQEAFCEEEMLSKEIQQVEVACLVKVFDQLRWAEETYATRNNLNRSSSAQGQHTNQQQTTQLNISRKEVNVTTPTPEGRDYFTAKDIKLILQDLGCEMSNAEVDQMIWEVDENLDDRVNCFEFNLMYRRCRNDTSGLEPRNLYNLVQFLMYLKSGSNASSTQTLITSVSEASNSNRKKTITVEDTLELLYVRYGRFNLDREIEEVFGKEEKNAQGQEKSITLTEYIDKQRKRDFAQRKVQEAERKIIKLPDQNKTATTTRY